MRAPFRFPEDLIALQVAWSRTYAALAEAPAGATALRRRLIALSGRLYSHPYWTSPPGSRRAGAVELRRAAHAVAEADAGREAA
ncbi:hypothetical protein [Streptomyces sp. NPDC093225]|uniref:hypothetical protein n=1 Tax=Streptomyces sp. NPDC093225 TaxID=3366034 RepID=UPI00380F1E87